MNSSRISNLFHLSRILFYSQPSSLFLGARRPLAAPNSHPILSVIPVPIVSAKHQDGLIWIASNHTHWEWGRGASPRKIGVLLPEEMGRWSWMGRINLCLHNNNKQQSYLVGCCSLDWMLMLISHASLNAFYMGHGDQCKIRWSCWKAWEAHWPLHPNNSPVCSFQLLSFE